MDVAKWLFSRTRYRRYATLTFNRVPSTRYIRSRNRHADVLALCLSPPESWCDTDVTLMWWGNPKPIRTLVSPMSKLSQKELGLNISTWESRAKAIILLFRHQMSPYLDWNVDSLVRTCSYSVSNVNLWEGMYWRVEIIASVFFIMEAP